MTRQTNRLAPLTGLLAVVVCAAAGPPGDVSGPPADVFGPPDGPRDPRIPADGPTEMPLPRLPEQVVMPRPSTFRVADSADRTPLDQETFDRALVAIRRGLAWLVEQQDGQGRWMAGVMTAPTDDPDAPSPVSVAVTSLAIKALVQAADEDARPDEQVRALQLAVHAIRSARNDDGGFDSGNLGNYVTSAVVSALASLESDDVYDDLHGGVAWLTKNQWDQGEGLRPGEDWFGGAGYGSRGRPDMSNTQMMLDALHDAGLSPDEPAFQRALAFATRAQNLRTDDGSEWTGNDGGFVYTPANGGESMASEVAGEGRKGELLPAGRSRSLRSYGSMTYAGFKSMLYAGLSPDDVRVRAAFDWIRRHWTFDENPGLGDQGLYYYYHVMSRALAAGQQHRITDVAGVEHDWRRELVAALLARQRADGSWANDADRWLEAEPVLATVYAILALEEALKPTIRR